MGVHRYSPHPSARAPCQQHARLPLTPASLTRRDVASTRGRRQRSTIKAPPCQGGRSTYTATALSVAPITHLHQSKAGEVRHASRSAATSRASSTVAARNKTRSCSLSQQMFENVQRRSMSWSYTVTANRQTAAAAAPTPALPRPPSGSMPGRTAGARHEPGNSRTSGDVARPDGRRCARRRFNEPVFKEVADQGCAARSPPRPFQLTSVSAPSWVWAQRHVCARGPAAYGSPVRARGRGSRLGCPGLRGVRQSFWASTLPWRAPVRPSREAERGQRRRALPAQVAAQCSRSPFAAGGPS